MDKRNRGLNHRSAPKPVPLLFAILACLGLLGCFATNGPPIDRDRSPHRALLVLDMQRDFLADDARLPIKPGQVASVLETTNSLIADAEAAGVDVIYVANEFSPDDFFGNLFRNQAAIEGSPGAELDPRLDVRGRTITKDAPDAFSNDELDALLREKRVGHLTVIGVFADQCVYRTVQGALNRNYRVTVVPEALGAASEEDRSDALEDFREAGVALVDAERWPPSG